VVLAADLMISEFMASNSNTLDDADGDASDWIEIFNAGSTATTLDRWYLTDTSNLTKWAFPNQTIQPGDYLIVFASGKNRAVAGQELHTNFQMAAGGEYLALVYDDPATGLEIVSEFEPAVQKTNVSYGFEQTFTDTSLIGPTAPVNALVPTDGSLGATWTQPGFDPAGWMSGNGAAGFDLGTFYDDEIGLDLESAMHNQNATAYIRYPFAGLDPATVDRLTMQISGDDGYLAYLNGTLVDSRLAPASPMYNSAATAENGGNVSVVDVDNFGFSTAGSIVTGTAATGAVSYFIPTDNSLYSSSPRWNQASFNDSAWSTTNSGVGYERPGTDTNYAALLGVNLTAQMDGLRTSLFVRKEFNITDPTAWHRSRASKFHGDAAVHFR
jgi:hypothetical protein